MCGRREPPEQCRLGDPARPEQAAVGGILGVGCCAERSTEQALGGMQERVSFPAWACGEQALRGGWGIGGDGTT